ncbi:PIG-L deacetylase family protein [Pseudohongiella spirulinae]|uniref:PIG-L family deacetylase n=1 Tax=Pseudohongiella spirulinae TaxID=1249552 RepID=A0A0S2K9S5_9GAMM|nr:PIG-L deacetylase family protein [Pseudohongiella spirulinae]ALO44754.1 hypothetical protein PS2015_56 [Pseudohongiella spirulinae]
MSQSPEIAEKILVTTYNLAMNPEGSLVPYESCQLPSGPWVVFAPHADDETFGMGGALRLASDNGIQIHVVVLTDGALGGSAGADAESLVAERQREVRAACAVLGVSSVETWPNADRGLALDDQLIGQIETVISRYKARTVFFPSVLELHPDHRATAVLVWAALQRIYQQAWHGDLPQPWSYEISVQSPVNRLLDITNVLQQKCQAMDVYASQNSQNNYPELILALNKARTFSLPAHVSHAEGFYYYPVEALARDLPAAARTALERYFEGMETKPGQRAS